MNSLCIATLVLAYSSVILCSTLQGGQFEVPQPNDSGEDFGYAAKPSSQNSYNNWIRYLLSNAKHIVPDMDQKRFTDFAMPYLKYKVSPVDKRNNGIWIWMPAQGYVSVPHQQEGATEEDGKPGKIMRYGK